MNLKEVPFLAFEISWRFPKTQERRNRLLCPLNKAIAVEVVVGKQDRRVFFMHSS